MVEIVCPNCSADLDIAIAPVHTCEFCGTAIQVSNIAGPDGVSITGEELSEDTKNTLILKEHYMVRCHYDASEARSIMQDWIKKIPGTPQDFENVTHITKQELKFYPIWVGEFTAESDYEGIDNWPQFFRPAHDRAGWFENISFHQNEESGHILREYQIPLLAMKPIPKYIRNYVVPTTGKEYFDITHVNELGATVIDSIYSADQVKRTMRLNVLNRQMLEMKKEVIQVTERHDDMDERDIYYIQFPVYEIEFTYNNKKFQAFIDGSTGRVIHIDVPISRKFKLLSLIGGIGQIILGVGLGILGLTVQSLIFAGASAGIGLIVFGSLLLKLGAKKGAQEKQT